MKMKMTSLDQIRILGKNREYLPVSFTTAAVTRQTGGTALNADSGHVGDGLGGARRDGGPAVIGPASA